MLLLGYAFSLGESITRQLKIYFGIQGLCATSLRPGAAAALLEKPELGPPMKKGSQLIARINIAGFHLATPRVSNSVVSFSKSTFKLSPAKGSEAYLWPTAVTLILIFIARLPVSLGRTYAL